MSRQGSIFNKLFGGGTVSKPEPKYGSAFAFMEPSEADKNRHEMMRATHELLEGLARDAIPAEFRKQDAIHAQHKTDHENDGAAYVFDCKKHGDFLTLFVTREVLVRTWEQSGFKTTQVVKKHSTSINLRECNQIYLSDGYAPDREGVGRFLYAVMDDKGEPARTGPNEGNAPAPDGHKYVVHAMASERVERPLSSFGGGKCEHDRYAYCSSGWHPYVIKTEITNAARAAKDDEITFSGLGTVYAPAGMGKAVHERILVELEKVAA